MLLILWIVYIASHIKNSKVSIIFLGVFFWKIRHMPTDRICRCKSFVGSHIIADTVCWIVSVF